MLYGAIFSDREIYECHTARLMKRASAIALLLKEKSEYLSVKGCGSSNIIGNLESFSEAALETEERGSFNLGFAAIEAKELENANRNLVCRLF